MSIKYHLVAMNDNIHSGKEKKKWLYPRVVRMDTVHLKELCQRASQGTTFNPVEMEAAVQMAVRRIEWELLHSNHVCIDGFGTFSLTAESRPVDNPDDIRAASIGVKRMVFVSSKTQMRRFERAVFERKK